MAKKRLLERVLRPIIEAEFPWHKFPSAGGKGGDVGLLMLKKYRDVSNIGLKLQKLQKKSSSAKTQIKTSKTIFVGWKEFEKEYPSEAKEFEIDLDELRKDGKLGFPNGPDKLDPEEWGFNVDPVAGEIVAENDFFPNDVVMDTDEGTWDWGPGYE